MIQLLNNISEKELSEDMANKDNYYIDKGEMLLELVAYRKLMSENDIRPKMPDKLGRMFYDIAKNLSNKGAFTNYTWKRDMISEAVYTCIRYVDKFDTDRDNPQPFSYFTTICYRSFLNYIKKQNRHSTIKDECFNNWKLLMEDKHYTEKAIDYEILK